MTVRLPLSAMTTRAASRSGAAGMLARVVEAGGRILQPKEFMREMGGWIAFVVDTEGNRIGIQQPG